jgi:hypothetical protein
VRLDILTNGAVVGIIGLIPVMPNRLDPIGALLGIKEALPKDRPGCLDALLDLDLRYYSPERSHSGIGYGVTVITPNNPLT